MFFSTFTRQSIKFPHKSFHITLARFVCIGIASLPIRIDQKMGEKLDCKTKILYNVGDDGYEEMVPKQQLSHERSAPTSIIFLNERKRNIRNGMSN